jgi:hypothetical protein
VSSESAHHGLAPEIIEMIRGEITKAISSLEHLLSSDDPRRISAILVLLEEIQPEFVSVGRKPWRAVPWLDCAIQLLKQVRASGIGEVREHISAARDLLERE